MLPHAKPQAIRPPLQPLVTSDIPAPRRWEKCCHTMARCHIRESLPRVRVVTTERILLSLVYYKFCNACTSHGSNFVIYSQSYGIFMIWYIWADIAKQYTSNFAPYTCTFDKFLFTHYPVHVFCVHAYIIHLNPLLDRKYYSSILLYSTVWCKRIGCLRHAVFYSTYSWRVSTARHNKPRRKFSLYAV